ncbi:MAG: hypothetical protein HOV87_12990 [Catenulispora sp.]|nr:hypothetical protein [Catenulispora sp.]
MAQDLPFLLREQAWDRLEEYRAEHRMDPENDSLESGAPKEEDPFEPGPGQVLQEYQRLRHAAEIAEQTYRRAQADGEPG